jgi:hypothetical protein
MNTPSARSIYVARSLPAAIDALNECGAAGAPFAGGTWIMRSPIRHEPHQPHYVAIGKIAELTAIRTHAAFTPFVNHARLPAISIPAAATPAAFRSDFRLSQVEDKIGCCSALQCALRLRYTHESVTLLAGHPDWLSCDFL